MDLRFDYAGGHYLNVNSHPDAEALRDQYQAQIDFEIEELKAVNAAGQSAIRSSMLVNGGGAVALLAFIGHLTTSPETADAVPTFALALTIFVLGVWLGGVSAGFTYLTALGRSIKLSDPQQLPTPKWRTFSNVTNWIAIICGAISLLFCFPAGCYFGYQSFEQLPPKTIPVHIKTTGCFPFRSDGVAGKWSRSKVNGVA